MMNSIQISNILGLLLMPGLLLSGCSKETGRENVKINVQPDTSGSAAKSPTEPASPPASASTGSEAAKEPDSTGAMRSISDQSEKEPEVVKPARGSVSDNRDAPQSTADREAQGSAGTGGTAASDQGNTPAGVDPELAARDTRVDYLTLELPAQGETAKLKPKQWIDQIALIDRGMRSLMLDQQANSISQGDFFTQARRLSEMKLAASEQLKTVAVAQTDQELAVLGKLEALSQLAGLGDRLRANELLSFASEQAKNIQSKAVARQASLVLLGFSLNQINSDSSSPESILQQVDAVLADRDKLRMPEFKMMEQVVGVLQRKNLSEIAKEVVKKTIDAFRSNPDPSIAYSVWHMSMAESPSCQAMLAEMAKEPTDPALLQKAIDEHRATDKSDWLLLRLSEAIKSFEFKGDLSAANILAKTVEDGKFASNAISEIAGREVDAYKKHNQMIGQSLTLTELEDLSGSPLNLSAYKGKVVLITFWASWSDRTEFADLRYLLETYKDKGFEIVGINVDDSQSAMRGVMQLIDMPWPNYHSSNPNRFGINTLAAQQVGLGVTPFSIVLDPTGKVVAVQLHGQSLKTQIESLLPNP